MKRKRFDGIFVRLLLLLYSSEVPVIRRLLADRLSIVEMI
jgi:hypothetical protein